MSWLCRMVLCRGSINVILSSFPIRGKYKIFILFSYPNRGIKTNGDWGGEWVVSDVLGLRAGGLMIFLGVFDVQQKFYGGRGRGG